MIIKINQCPNKSYWYADKIGDEFRVIKVKRGDYLVVPKDGLWVSWDDCEVIK